MRMRFARTRPRRVAVFLLLPALLVASAAAIRQELTELFRRGCAT
jgi:hypothetical protein